MSGISYRRIGVTNPSYRRVGNLLPKNRGYKPLLQRCRESEFPKNRGYKPLLQRCRESPTEESGLQTPPTKIVAARGVPKNRGYKPLLQKSRESEFRRIGVTNPSYRRIGNLLPKNRGYKPLLQRSGIGVPSYKDRESEFPPTKIITFFDELCVFFAKNCNIL